MLKDTRIAFIGAGAMGGAMIEGLLSRKLVTPDQIVASDPDEEITGGCTKNMVSASPLTICLPAMTLKSWC